ncbi:MAG: flavoprotein [Planctomycetota bacterium]
MATILLAVTGSIAVYKAADLASKLKQAGHDVRVMMSEAAQRLVTPSTFLNLTGNKVFTDLWDPDGQTQHIALTDQAELCVLAPATANALAKLALGLADDMVSTTLLALDCPLLVCPAMNTRMWRNPAVQENLARVRARGHQVLEPEAGALACGHVGPGRLAEPVAIAAAVEALLRGEAIGAAAPLAAVVAEGWLLPRLWGEWRCEVEVEGVLRAQRVSASPLLGRLARVSFFAGPDLGAAELTVGFDDARACYVAQVVGELGGPLLSAGTGEREGEHAVRFRLDEGARELRLTWLPEASGFDLAQRLRGPDGSWTELAARRLRRAVPARGPGPA